MYELRVWLLEGALYHGQICDPQVMGLNSGVTGREVRVENLMVPSGLNLCNSLCSLGADAKVAAQILSSAGPWHWTCT